jgi:GNAT superfamily N-acetyltransferase
VAAEPRARAIAYRRATHAQVCDRIEPWAHGSAVWASALPTYWDYNLVRLEGADPGFDPDELTQLLDELQAPLAHRRLEIWDAAAGERLRPAFQSAGWMTERLLWLWREGAPAGAAPAEEVAFADTRPLREAWTRTAAWPRDEADVQGFMKVEQIVAELRGTRALVARDDRGGAIGFATFSVAGDAAEIEQAYIEPAHRGRGLGGELVASAAALAGTREVFIVADDEGDPKRLYMRLGFEPAWVQHYFTLRPTE